MSCFGDEVVLTKCFYCGYPTGHGKGSPGDHFPVPEACGGTDTVQACWACHNLKDNLSLERIAFGMPEFIRELTISGNADLFFSLIGHAVSSPLESLHVLAIKNWAGLGRAQRILIGRILHDGYIARQKGVKFAISADFARLACEMKLSGNL